MSPSQFKPGFSWSAVDTVLLDMDGTLLDKYFDDHFWEEYIPRIFAEAHGLSAQEARKELLQRYQSVEDTLQWADLDYWSRQLGLDIPELKCKVDHLIQVHPYVVDFLNYIKSLNKTVHLVTNAHSKTLDLKLRKTVLGSHFDRIVCAGEIGYAKEQPEFWSRLQDLLHFDEARTLLADDTAKVLHAAQQYGIGFLIFVARPSSRLPVKHSKDFPSIVFFNELIPQ